MKYYYNRKNSFRYKLEKWFCEESRAAAHAVFGFIVGLITCALLLAFVFIVFHIFH